jgi:hypothetical protein
MREATRILEMVVLAGAAAVAATCASPPPPEPPAPVPVVAISPPPQPDPPPDEWNIFPDPTTGKIDVYHKGAYMGAIDGTEPTEQDPPMPHKSEDPGFDY